MLIFSGELSNECKNYLIKKNAKILRIISFITMIIISIPIIICGILFSHWVFLFLTVTLLIGFLLSSDNRKNIVTNFPQKIWINNVAVKSETDKGTREISITAVKKVLDEKNWYFIVFKFGQKSNYFICQKSLLTQGSLEEFEKIFADKLVRKS